MEEKQLNKQLDCFRIGALVSMNVQSSADSLVNGDKKQAKADLLGMKDVLDESCIGKPFCDNLKRRIDSAVQALDSDNTKQAQEEIDEIIAVSIHNKPIKEEVEEEVEIAQ